MRNYELVLIIDSAQAEKEQKNWSEKIKKWLGSGRVQKEENWGQKKLAYPLKKQNEAVYFFYLLQAPPSALKNLEAKLKLEETVLRYLIIKSN